MCKLQNKTKNLNEQLTSANLGLRINIIKVKLMLNNHKHFIKTIT